MCVLLSSCRRLLTASPPWRAAGARRGAGGHHADTAPAARPFPARERRAQRAPRRRGVVRTSRHRQPVRRGVGVARRVGHVPTSRGTRHTARALRVRTRRAGPPQVASLTIVRHQFTCRCSYWLSSVYGSSGECSASRTCFAPRTGQPALRAAHPTLSRSGPGSASGAPHGRRGDGSGIAERRPHNKVGTACRHAHGIRAPI